MVAHRNLTWLASIAAALCISAGCSPEAAPRIRNVVLISIDTLRADHLGCYGYARPTSPFLDELAEGGVLFERAISQAPWTTPAHASLLASAYPSALGLGSYWNQVPLPERAELLAELARKQGLRTLGVADGGLVAGVFGFDRGFERYADKQKGMRRTVDVGLKWMNRLGPDEPFFLFLHTYDVHFYAPPAEARKLLVRPYGGALRYWRDLAEVLQRPSARTIVDGFDAADRGYVVDLYDASIRAVDSELRRLFAAFAEADRARETLFVITSDHGEELFERGRSGHGYSLFDENLRVPLILVHPSLGSRRVAEVVGLIDVAPTIAALAEWPTPKAWQGASLLPLLDGSSDGARPAYSEHTHSHPSRSVRLGDAKLVAIGEEPEVRLYDLSSDPAERSDLAGTGHPAEVRLAELLRAWGSANESLPKSPGAEPLRLGEELQRQLESLGYVED